MLKVFLDAGGTLVDTAAAYGDGDSERGARLAARPGRRRDEVVVATKAGIVRHGRGAHRRHLARCPARPAGRARSAARHRPRRPVAGAHLVVGRPDRGDADRAGLRGVAAVAPATSASPTTPAGRPRRRRPGSRPCPAGRRSPRPRSSTRCWSAASSARSCPPRWSSASACCLVAAGSRGADRQVPHRDSRRLAGRDRALLRVRRPVPDRGRRPDRDGRRAPRRRAWTSRRWRSRWRGCGTGLGSPRPIAGRADGRAALGGSWRPTTLSLPDEIRVALDEVSRPSAGYPEHGRDQR